jgi:ATP-dependent DNA helicase RecG
MSQKEIRLIYSNITAIPFEERINKDVSFGDISRDKIQAFFREAGISVSKIVPQDVLSSLNLSKKASIKNAGVLFFAKMPRKIILQCQMTLVALTGTDRINIYDRKDIQDDLLTQFNEAVIFLQRHLNVRSEIKGVNRKDICEIPIEALREAVANAIIHRDYSMRGTSIMVEVHENRIVISNPGGLLEGLSPKSLMNISVRRNELIADMFARMDKVERMGTGIKRMRDLAKTAGLPYPKIESDFFFTITFMRPPYSLKKAIGSEKSSEKSSEKIFDIIRADNRISAKRIAEKLGISPRAVEKQIANLKSDGKLKRDGPAKGGHWEIIKNKNH